MHGISSLKEVISANFNLKPEPEMGFVIDWGKFLKATFSTCGTGSSFAYSFLMWQASVPWKPRTRGLCREISITITDGAPSFLGPL